MMQLEAVSYLYSWSLYASDALEMISDWHVFRAASRCGDKNRELIKGIEVSS